MTADDRHIPTVVLVDYADMRHRTVHGMTTAMLIADSRRASKHAAMSTDSGNRKANACRQLDGKLKVFLDGYSRDKSGCKIEGQGRGRVAEGKIDMIMEELLRQPTREVVGSRPFRQRIAANAKVPISPRPNCLIDMNQKSLDLKEMKSYHDNCNEQIQFENIDKLRSEGASETRQEKHLVKKQHAITPRHTQNDGHFEGVSTVKSKMSAFSKEFIRRHASLKPTFLSKHIKTQSLTTDKDMSGDYFSKLKSNRNVILYKKNNNISEDPSNFTMQYTNADSIKAGTLMPIETKYISGFRIETHQKPSKKLVLLPALKKPLQKHPSKQSCTVDSHGRAPVVNGSRCSIDSLHEYARELGKVELKGWTNDVNEVIYSEIELSHE